MARVESEKRSMMARFTDNARAVIRTAFRRQPATDLRDVLNVLGGRRGGLAAHILTAAGVEIERLPAGCTAVGRAELVSNATDIARSRGTPYVGTEHLLLALARLQDSALAGIGAAYGRLDTFLSAVQDEWRRAHPPLARRLGTLCRAGIQRAAGWMRRG
jgi:hypothetical protein